MTAQATEEAPSKTAIQTEVQCYSFPSPKSRPARTRSLTQLVDVSEVLYQRIMLHPLEAVELSSLARALCDVDKRIRAWKGLPEPGHLMPGIEHAKRGKRGRVIELAKGASFNEAVEAPATKEPKAQ